MSSSAPLVSICIPAYARPLELRVAVSSALAQTSGDIEVIVTDDSGRHQDLVSEFSDSRLRYFVNAENLGMAGNWQRCLTLARGRFVGLLMDDDRLLPRFVERCLAVFAAEPSVGVVFTNHFFDDGVRLRARPSPVAGGTYTDFLATLLRHKPVAVCATLMRREVWNEVLPVPDVHTADLAIQIRAAQSDWAFHYIDEPLMVYRVHAGQLSGDLDFRDHGVRLWRMFAFAQGSEEETLRRRLLTEALLSSAAARIQRGDTRGAAELAREAESVGLAAGELTARARITLALARSPLAMRGAAEAFRLLGRLRAVGRSHQRAAAEPTETAGEPPGGHAAECPGERRSVLPDAHIVDTHHAVGHDRTSVGVIDAEVEDEVER